ncbi:hypothetical protein DER44DRAFT_853812, partial [Fusarium oxysporum]
MKSTGGRSLGPTRVVDEDNIRQLKCKHLFHMRCIDLWFQKHHVDCPLCKAI